MRIQDERLLMRNYDYAVVKLVINGEITLGVIWRYAPTNRYYFLTNDSSLDGSTPCNLTGSGFSYGWASCVCPEALSVIQLMDKFNRNGEPFRLHRFFPTQTTFDIDNFNIWVSSYVDETDDGTRERETNGTSVTFDSNAFISDKYEREAIYRGQHHYHRHHGSYFNTPLSGSSDYLIGVELEVEFGSNVDAMYAFNSSPSNWFYRETDSSLGSGGVEIITVPLLPCDAKSEEFWKPLVDSIKPYARSWDTGRCGLHVHIGRRILGNPCRDDFSEVIGKMLYFYHHCLKDTGLNVGIYGRSQGYHEPDGKTETSRAVDVLGASTVLKHKEIQERVKDSLLDRSRDERYFDINLLNSATIEFRKGRGSLDTKRIVAIIEWSEIIVRYAKSTPWENISYSDFLNFLKVISIESTLIKEQMQRFI